MHSTSRSERLIGAAEITSGLLLTLGVVVLHLAVFQNAGGLWRDEVHTVNLAGMPPAEMWSETLTNESFPALWPLTLRAWTGLVGGDDASLRMLGLIVGLGLVATLWWTAVRFGYRVPLFSLVLCGAAPAIFRYGDSMRAWGLGCILLLMMLVAIDRLREQNTFPRQIIAGLFALLAVQSLYYNCVLLFAIGCSAAVVALYTGDLKRAIVVGMVGIVAAVSMTPYLLGLEQRQIGLRSSQAPIGLRAISAKFAEAVNLSGDLMFSVWICVTAVALAVCGVRFLRATETRHRERALFIGLCIVAAVGCYVGFLLRARMLTQPWYYAALITILAVLLEAALHLGIGQQLSWRIGRLVIVAVLAVCVAPRAWSEAQQRMTNVDLIAAQLEDLADEGDYIVVNPLWRGITFERYYNGPAEWDTVPPLSDHRLHRAIELSDIMQQPAPLEPLLQKLRQTLASGHRVWVVGGLQFLPPGETPADYPPAPHGKHGWQRDPYLNLWSQQTACLLREYAAQVKPVPLPQHGPVQVFENMPVMMVEGEPRRDLIGENNGRRARSQD